MIDIFLQWVREIFIIGLMSEIFIALIKSEQYKRYINYITGLMIICICLRMIFAFLGINISEKSLTYFEKNMIYSDSHIKNSFNSGSSGNNEIYIQSYIDANVKYIEQQAAEYGLVVTDTDIDIDNNNIASIKVSVTGTDNIDNCMEFKQMLVDIYDIDSSNVSVYWRKK